MSLPPTRVTHLPEPLAAPAHRASPHVVLLSVLLLALCAAATLVVIASDEQAGYLLATVTATATLTLLFIAEYRKVGNALSPLCLSYLVLFLLFPFHGLMTRESLFLKALIGGDAATWRGYALLVMSTGALCFHLGYNSRLGERLARRLPSPRLIVDDAHPNTRLKIVALYVLAIVPRFILFSTGRIFHWNAGYETSDFDFILQLLGTIPVFATTYVVVVGLVRKNRTWLITGLLMLAGEVLWGLLSGSRKRMFIPLVSILAAVSYLGRPVRLRRFVLVLVAFALVVYPFTTAFRIALVERSGSSHDTGVGVGTVVDAMSDAAGDNDDIAFLVGDEGPLASLAERMHGLTSLALIMRYTPERHDYLYGVPYLFMVPQVLIPRFVWPSKPALGPFVGSFRTDYWGLQPDSSTSVACSLFGDLWVNGHLVGILLGSFFFAAFLAYARKHVRFGIAGESVFPVVVFAVLLTDFLHALEGTLDGSFTGLVKNLLVYFAIAWFVSIGRQRKPATHQGAP